MKTIWKFKVFTLIDSRGSVDMPKGAKILSIGLQEDDVCIWALIDTKNESKLIKRQFRLFGTGWEIKEPLKNLNYIGTVFMQTFVWHIFEELK